MEGPPLLFYILIMNKIKSNIMFDISKEKISIDCPECKRKHQVTLQQVANQATIRCSCSANIKLTDKNGSARRSIQEINSSFKKLDDAFKRLGR